MNMCKDTPQIRIWHFAYLLTAYGRTTPSDPSRRFGEQSAKSFDRAVKEKKRKNANVKEVALALAPYLPSCHLSPLPHRRRISEIPERPRSTCHRYHHVSLQSIPCSTCLHACCSRLSVASVEDRRKKISNQGRSTPCVMPETCKCSHP